MATGIVDNPVLIRVSNSRIASATTQTDINDIQERLDVLYAAGSFSTVTYNTLVASLTTKAAELGLA